MQTVLLLRDAGFLVRDLFTCLVVSSEREITPLEIMSIIEGCTYSKVSRIDAKCVIVTF